MGPILAKRLERFARSFPRHVAAEFGRYQKLHRADKRWNSQQKAANRPYWSLLPVWLVASYVRAEKKPDSKKQILNDILWAQYCLFLFVRIQDDVFDGHVQSPSLIFIADQFLFEAQDVFSGYFARSSIFWKLFRTYVQESTLAVTEVDRLQKSPVVNSESLLTEYARVNAIFKIGSAAVCLEFGRMKDFSLIENSADEMAIGCQILDDLEDVSQDLERKRFNYAANIILRRKPKPEKGDDIPRFIAKAIVLSSAGDELLTEVRRRFSRASAHLSKFELPAVQRVYRAYEKALQRTQISFHQKRARVILNQKNRFF